MDKQQWDHLSNIIDTALELSEKERSSYIERECRGKPDMKREVTELLRAIDQSGAESYLEDLNDYPRHLAREISETEMETFSSSLIGTPVDNYEIVDLIGHGGMGSVFLAERSDKSITQKVALKLLRRGMDTPSNIARFRRERNILAKLDHPNIARLLDGGMTEDNLPYLVMEYVEGAPLYTYCDEHQLSVEERLDLFKDICDAVQQAHNNAIIHRDLKPSNILVTEDGVVKILDFGIAKIAEPKDPDNTELFETRTGARILTPAYATPEQLSHSPITTKTDIYALGTLLYELLAGVHPFELEGKKFNEIEDLIRHKTPPSPADRFKNMDTVDRQAAGKCRNTSPEVVQKKLRGDLGAIVMKALRKDPDGRYNTVSQLLEDLRRRENSLAIIAREDTFSYKVSKFSQRYRKELTSAAAVLLLFTVMVAYYTFQLSRERNEARIEAQKAQQVSSFLTSLFRAGNPTYHPADTVTAATLLKRGKKRLKSLDNQPEVRAQLSTVIGSAYLELGKFNQARPLIEQSQKLGKKLFGPASLEYAEALKSHGILQRKMGNFAKAESLQQKGQSIYQNSSDATHLTLAGSLNELGWTVYELGNYGRADSLYLKALRQIEKSPKPAEKIRAHILINRSSVLRKMGDLDKAERFARKALSIRKRKFGEIHPHVGMAYNDLGLILDSQGNNKQADSLYHRGLSISQRLYDTPHPDISTTLYNIGSLYREQKKYKKALDYLSRSLDMERQILGNTHPTIAITLSQLASVAREMEKFKKAARWSHRALSIRKEKLPNIHPKIATAYHDLGLIMHEWGKTNRADSLYHKSLEVERQLHTVPNEGIAATFNNMGNLHFEEKNYDKAESYLSRALRIRRKVFQITHPEITETLNELAQLYQEMKKESIFPLLENALQVKDQPLKENNGQKAYSNVLLGKALLTIDRYKLSEQLILRGYQTLKKEQSSQKNYIQKAEQYLAELYDQWDKPVLSHKYRMSGK